MSSQPYALQVFINDWEIRWGTQSRLVTMQNESQLQSVVDGSHDTD